MNIQDKDTSRFQRKLADEIEWYADFELREAFCHDRASDIYGNINRLFGLPTAVLASISGVSAFTQYSKIAGITAFVAAGLAGAMSFLNPAEKERLHSEAGNALEAWTPKTYLVVKKARANLIEPSVLITQWQELMTERAELRRKAPTIPAWAKSKELKERILHPFGESDSDSESQ